MKRVAGGGVDVTAAEQVLLAVCASHEGMREMADRRGRWSRQTEPKLNRSWPSGARKMLNKFGDWKMGSEEITHLCGEARKVVGI